jgi:hypothetical protein
LWRDDCLSEAAIRLLAMKKLLSLFAVALLTLTGCAESSAPSAPAPESSQSAPENQQSQENQEPVSYQQAIADSYAKLYETGMSEEALSSGDRYILSYTPQEKFIAGLYNFEFDDIVLIEEEEFFTVASAYLALQDPVTVIAETDSGVSITHPDYGDFTIVIENGLVVSGFGNGGGWNTTVIYAPNDMVTELVEARLLSEGDSE